MNKIDKILLILGIFILVFVTFMCVTFWRFQSVPDTLIVAVLGAGGIETVATAFITIKKWKNKD